jgi:hypothetical protein
MKNIYHIMKNHPHSGNVSLKKKKKVNFNGDEYL